MAYKATILCQFDGPPPTGFAESWTFDTTDEAMAKQLAVDVAQARRRCLAKQWYVGGVRLAKLVKRHSEKTGKDFIGQVYVDLPCSIFGPNAKGQAGATDSPWAAVYVRIETRKAVPEDPLSKGKPRFQQMRGVPDTIWDGANAFNKREAQQLLDPFLSQVVNSTGGRLSAGHPHLFTGQALGQQCAVDGYLAYCIHRASSRRIGRPFYLLRGRQSARSTG